MVRDDLYITIPTFFRCPISLDVMKSPVSLCTGVTYDRASIQRWLDSGNNTCPATMQVLQSKEFVPNHTLQRLIQIWSDSVQRQSRRVDPAANNAVSIPSQDEVKRIVNDIGAKQKEANFIIESLTTLTRFCRESEENREFLVKKEEFVPMLIDFLGNGDEESTHRSLELLDLVMSKIGDYEQVMTLILKENLNCLSSLLHLLKQGSMDSKIRSVRVLESIAIDVESKLLIAEKEGLLHELVKSISREADPSLIEASLSCLTAISKPKRVKLKLVHLKIVTELRNLLFARDNKVSITEKALKLLEMVSSCKEGRVEMCKDSACVEAVAQKVLKVSGEATEHAVTILWSICYLFKDQRAQETVNKSNGLTKILLLMQSNCSPAVRQMSADLLKIIRVNSKSCLSSYDTKTTHIMPF